MKVKTAELIGKPLNWAVGKCLGYPDGYPRVRLGKRSCGFGWADIEWDPSTDISQGCPILDRELIARSIEDDGETWRAWYPLRKLVDFHNGPTSLIAGLRCFVGRHYGQEIEIPDELIQ